MLYSLTLFYFFSQLPESLLTFRLYPEFIRIAKVSDFLPYFSVMTFQWQIQARGLGGPHIFRSN